MRPPAEQDEFFMRRALRLAELGYGGTSPNPMVGAVLVKGGRIIGEGYHRRAGEAHAEINALRSAQRKGEAPKGATLYVTLEPCSTTGRTPPCTQAVIAAGIRRVVIAATDPNPRHRGKAFRELRSSGIEAATGVLKEEASRLNASFNHWIVTHRPLVTLKAAMTLDGRIATKTGESKWITGEKARARGMKLRLGADAIVAGINTILRDDPALTVRAGKGLRVPHWKTLLRVVLDRRARIPLDARVLGPAPHAETVVVVGDEAPVRKVRALERKARVLRVPERKGALDLTQVVELLGAENITAMLVEGGGETHARFLEMRLADRVAFFYAPKVFGGRDAPRAVGGDNSLPGSGARLSEVKWEKLGEDLLLTACVKWGPG